MKKFILAFLLALSTPAFATEVITLTPANTLSLRSEVSDETVSQLIMKLSETQQDTIYLYINSPGGSIVAGNDLIQAIRSSGKKIVCIANFAASMAFSILQSCDRRLILESAIVMQHEAAYEARGSVTKNRKTLEFVEKLAFKLNRDDAKRIGMDLATFKAHIHDEWWLFGSEIVSNGVADGIVGVRCSAAMSKAREIQTIDSVFGQAVVTWSSCPLVTYPVSVEVKMKFDADLRDFTEWTRSLNLDQDWKTRKETR